MLLRIGRAFLVLWLTSCALVYPVRSQAAMLVATAVDDDNAVTATADATDHALEFHMRVLPQFHLDTTVDKACYSFEEAKELAIADREYFNTQLRLNVAYDKLALVTDAYSSLQVDTAEAQQDLNEAEADLSAAIRINKDQERLIQKLSKRPDPVVVVLTVVGSTVVAAFIGFGVGYGADLVAPAK